MAPRLQVGHNQKAVCLILLIMLVSSCRDGSRDNRGLVPASHNNASQPPRLESAEETLALPSKHSATAKSTRASSPSDGDSRVALLAGRAVENAMRSSLGAHPPIGDQPVRLK